ncbi:MAG: serine protein kinase PrkA [Acidobacteria bacterium]|nr:serine protein kinase PrkA [Acidobacteriota bacterium]
MENNVDALQSLDETLGGWDKRAPVLFQDFLNLVKDEPKRMLRNIFQVFHDMILSYVGEGVDEFPDDPESVGFVHYNCEKLFVEGCDHPFFADRLFANRLFDRVEAIRRGAQQNKLYIFEGPPGSGKSTFLNNLLHKLEDYANTEEGVRYEAIWKVSRKDLGLSAVERDPTTALEMLLSRALAAAGSAEEVPPIPDSAPAPADDVVEIPCPSHDHPILLIPKQHRRGFLDDLLRNDELKWKIFTEKEYEWVFRDVPCTICASLYQALLERLKSHRKVFGMIHTRRYLFNRRVGEGITVFNPGDTPIRQMVLENPMLQNRINVLLQDSNRVRYIFSPYAKTNNGIYALMDIKSNNKDRLLDLHNIISEGVHKVDDVEENVNSLFIALMNPEDRANIQGIQSFSDRLESINIPYVLDINTEVSIYRNIFARRLDDDFLPRVLHNFARVIVSTRLNTRSDALLEWIGSPRKYNLYCDENLLLLKMEIYTGNIPVWLSEEDRKKFTARRRRQILAESEADGVKGLSGRDSIKIFGDFHSTYVKDGTPINMSMLKSYFSNVRKDIAKSIPSDFLESLVRMYDYTVLQEVKESLYNYNEEQISRDVVHYLFAVNFDPGAVETCRFTGERLEVTPEFFDAVEKRILGAAADAPSRKRFRRDTQKEYAAHTLTQEILMEKKTITETELYRDLYGRYVHNLKERVLEPFLDNENFRNAVKEYGEESFKTYDQRIREDVDFLMRNLVEKRRYSPQGAKEVCIYVMDNDLARKFGGGKR